MAPPPKEVEEDSEDEKMSEDEDDSSGEEVIIPKKKGKKAATTPAKKVVVSPAKKVAVATPAKKAGPKQSALSSVETLNGGQHHPRNVHSQLLGGQLSWKMEAAKVGVVGFEAEVEAEEAEVDWVAEAKEALEGEVASEEAEEEEETTSHKERR
ncbi:Nucleolin [Tupaia chinensis]|uniref:Nucleolin n=1 Tax=Tupaia chinensis TaxID=246437 RepID=L9KG66_TUPCH|nr:Nucleolin [Tupaia chinensis]